MLTALQIRNFAIIEEQTISFAAGLNVISGETGSGKSIILNALEIILGGRPKTHSIRESAEEMEVQAQFDLSGLSPEALAALPEIAQSSELVLGRTLNRQGKGKVFINGRLATVSLLEETGQRLINICRQGQQLSLLDPRYHRELVDDFGGHAELLSQHSRAFDDLRRAELKLSEAKQFQSGLGERREKLEEIVREIKPLKLHAGRRLELEGKVRKLEGGERIVLGMQAAVTLALEEGGAHEVLGAISAKLSELSRIDPQIAELNARVERARSECLEFEREANAYLHRVDLDSQSLEVLRDELAEVARLERKYRTNDEGLAILLADSISQLSALEEGADPQKLEQEVSVRAKLQSELASKLTAAREKAAKRLAAEVESDLKELNMPDAKFSTQRVSVNPTVHGADSIEFMISTNRGESFKSLKQVASGGELSRIMLVLKKTLRDRSNVNVLVFDEVDTGVSGKVARAMGEKLHQLAGSSQVICITHLAQIASLADHHLLVDKQVGKRTISIIREIAGEEKVEEIARMLAGYKVTSAARESARELLASKLE